MKSNTKNSEKLVQCPACETYLGKEEGFRCPQCRRSPLCRRHRVPGKRECDSCVHENLMGEIIVLRKQEQSIRNFIKLLQFIFLVCSVFFIALKIGLADTVVFLQNNIIADNILFFGGGAVTGCVIFYIILYARKGRIRNIEDMVQKIQIRRNV